VLHTVHITAFSFFVGGGVFSGHGVHVFHLSISRFLSGVASNKPMMIS